MITKPTALPVDRLSDKERVAEAAAILAAGVIRYRQAQQQNIEEKGSQSGLSLDFMPGKSVHAKEYQHGDKA